MSASEVCVDIDGAREGELPRDEDDGAGEGGSNTGEGVVADVGKEGDAGSDDREYCSTVSMFCAHKTMSVEFDAKMKCWTHLEC